LLASSSRGPRGADRPRPGGRILWPRKCSSARPHALSRVPAVAFAAAFLPWVARRAQQVSRRAAEARTYTG
jgi:hypothetical protein